MTLKSNAVSASAISFAKKCVLVLLLLHFSNKSIAAFTTELRITDSSNISWDRVLVIFDSTTHPSYDTLMDAAKMLNPDLNFYSSSSDGVDLAIDRRPYVNGQVIPLSLNTPYNKGYLLKFTANSMPSGTSLYLHDKYLNTTTLIVANNYYYFIVNDDSLSQGNERFELLCSGYPNCLTGAATASNTHITLENLKLTLSHKADVFCNGSNDGSISIAVQGGAAPYSYHWNNNATTKDNNGLSAGSYTVTVTDANGNKVSDTYSIAQPLPLAGNITANPVYTVPGQQSYTIYTGYGPQSVSLTAAATGGSGNYTYKWWPATGLSTPDSAYTIAAPGATTTYTVTITDARGCVKSLSITINVIDIRNNNNTLKICHKVSSVNWSAISASPTAVAIHLAHGDNLGHCDNASGAKENDLPMDHAALNLYPNPSSGLFCLEIPDNTSDAEIVISDMSGKIVEKRTVSGPKHNFDLSAQPKGIYMVRVLNNEIALTAKLVIR